MSELVQELRRIGDWREGQPPEIYRRSLINEAADEIERLRAALEKYRPYVEDAAGMDCKVYTKHLSDGPCGACWSCLAREALRELKP